MRERRKDNLERYHRLNEYFKWLLLAVVVLTVTICLYPSLVVKQHTYMLGDVVENDFKAPKDFLFEDTAATELNVQNAVAAVQTVYDHDTTLSQTLANNVKAAFTDIQQIIQAEAPSTSQPLNLENPNALSTQETEAERLEREAVQAKQTKEKLWQHKTEFEKKLGITLSEGAFTILEKEAFSNEIAGYITKILIEVLDNGVVASKEILLREAEKGIILRQIEEKTETAETNLRQFYGLDQSKVMVRIIGQPLLKDINYNLRNLIVDVVQNLIQPNITLNKSESEERKKKAAADIKPIFYKIKSGEMLLREGERVNSLQLLKLKALESQYKDEGVLTRSVGAAMAIIALFVISHLLYIPHLRRLPGSYNRNLLCMTAIFVFFIGLAKAAAVFSESLGIAATLPINNITLFYGVPIGAGAMTICLFFGIEIAIPFAVLTAICTALIYNIRFEILVYLILNGVMAAYWIQNCRERKVFAKAGLKLGLLNIVLAIAAEIYTGDPMGMRILWSVIFGFAGGVAAGAVTSGLSPLIEMAFGYTTDITLLELANLDRPILKRLMIEAPGTYHHSMVVGTMVEAAASEIGANPLLAKVCGYYHDIGKINKPLYFVENQEDGINRHDKLAPSMSSLILIAHVKDGMEIGRENKLGQAIIDTIEQHHGTSLIRYFYEKAKSQKGEHAVKIENFRYPGPRPQTREAGLVMLADVLEAASRTLDNPTTARIQKQVQDLINHIFSDGQLDNCELTLKDLHNIARSFNKILTGIHHHRIDYPEKKLSAGRIGKNGSADRKQAGQVRDFSAKRERKSAGHLRRLGQSQG
jgi:putative nucleotidyltransferase with HDIG domain